MGSLSGELGRQPILGEMTRRLKPRVGGERADFLLSSHGAWAFISTKDISTLDNSLGTISSLLLYSSLKQNAPCHFSTVHLLFHWTEQGYKSGLGTVCDFLKVTPPPKDPKSTGRRHSPLSLSGLSIPPSHIGAPTCLFCMVVSLVRDWGMAKGTHLEGLYLLHSACRQCMMNPVLTSGSV